MALDDKCVEQSIADIHKWLTDSTGPLTQHGGVGEQGACQTTMAEVNVNDQVAQVIHTKIIELRKNETNDGLTQENASEINTLSRFLYATGFVQNHFAFFKNDPVFGNIAPLEKLRLEMRYISKLVKIDTAWNLSPSFMVDKPQFGIVTLAETVEMDLTTNIKPPDDFDLSITIALCEKPESPDKKIGDALIKAQAHAEDRDHLAISFNFKKGNPNLYLGVYAHDGEGHADYYYQKVENWTKDDQKSGRFHLSSSDGEKASPYMNIVGKLHGPLRIISGIMKNWNKDIQGGGGAHKKANIKLPQGFRERYKVPSSVRSAQMCDWMCRTYSKKELSKFARVPEQNKHTKKQLVEHLLKIVRKKSNK